MKQYCFIIISVSALFLLGGCATFNSKTNSLLERSINQQQKMNQKLDRFMSGQPVLKAKHSDGIFKPVVRDVPDSVYDQPLNNAEDYPTPLQTAKTNPAPPVKGKVKSSDKAKPQTIKKAENQNLESRVRKLEQGLENMQEQQDEYAGYLLQKIDKGNSVPAIYIGPFAAGKTAMTKDMVKNTDIFLAILTKVVKNKPGEYELNITAYADERGPKAKNQALSNKRAVEFNKYLSEKLTAAKLTTVKIVSAKGGGELKLRYSEKNNRCVQIDVKKIS